MGEIREFAANVFFVATDSRGRLSVDSALVPDVEHFKRKLVRYWKGGGGSVKFITKDDYLKLLAQQTKGVLN
jgi:hypothetical protein